MNPVVVVDVTEQKRLNDAREAHITWKKWGPYLSERQWGTVREDYNLLRYQFPSVRPEPVEGLREGFSAICQKLEGLDIRDNPAG